MFDTLKMSNLENTAETVYAKGGKGNANLIGWDFNRTATFNMQDALISTEALALIAGQKAPTKGKTTVHGKEVLTVDADKVTLTNAPLNDKVNVYKFENGGLGEKIASPTVLGKEVTVTGTTGDVIVFYQYETNADAEVIEITADNFPGFYKVVGDTVMRNQVTGVDEALQIVLPKVKLLPGFTLTLEAEGDPSAFDFACEVLKDDKSTQMVKLIRYK